MHLAQVSQALNGQVIGNDVALSGVTTDTRGNCTGELFIALKGERFDAHDFVADAFHAGASAALLEHDVDVELPKILVADTHQALKDLAAWWRSQFVIPVIGITGSVGKTTVKEMLGSIFAEVGEGVVTKGNLNNEIGVPLTLLRLATNDRYAIVEMGMNHAGEISRLTKITKPTIALINNAAAAHLEGLGTIEAVAKAKGEIFEGLTGDGIAIINADDKYSDMWRELAYKQQIVSFGLQKSADISADFQLHVNGISMQVKTPEENFEVQLSSLGKHSVANALAATAVAYAANIPSKFIQTGLTNYRPIGGRLDVSKIGALTIIDDTYNANPASMQSAIEVLAQYDNSILIVGDMAELGDASDVEHIELGKFALKNNINHIYVCGKYADLVSQGSQGLAQSFVTQGELLEVLSLEVGDKAGEPNSAILVKGSRSARMEKVIDHLQQTLSQQKQIGKTGGSH
ncbi:MAG: UDP-N-acetylmuramoyl-tripeptide--D-alanyl-D-alanine ligase [Acidiferrobacterales bacterium]|nr:UDP-N-acetylmuramoyl-tripeptide--D-alanyl-D-alanine ligase [Acidiferrobacterales bacterium]